MTDHETIVSHTLAAGSYATCSSCPWNGPLRDNRDQAERDAETHTAHPYADGGLIEGDGTNVPMIISPGCILVDADTYDRLGPDRLRELNQSPDAEIEIYMTRDQALARHGINLDRLNTEETDHE